MEAGQLDAADCGPFHFVEYSNPADTFTAQKSVLLRLAVNGEVGTGFLIDTDNGYVMTARHVVIAAKESHTHKITGAFEFSLKNQFSLKLVDDDVLTDIAIVQIESPEYTKGLHPFELSLSLPPDDSLVALGGFQYGDDDKALSDSGKMSRNKNGRFEVRANNFPGDSGGPVLDRQGLVIGVIVQRRIMDDFKTGGIAVASPIAKFRNRLLKLQANPRSDLMATKILSETSQQEQLIDEFKARDPRRKLSNLDLLHMMQTLKSKAPRTIHAKTQELIRCPVHTAADHRNLSLAASELILPLMAQQSLAVQGQWQAKIAEQLALIGELEHANSYLASAEKSFAQALSNYLSPNTALDACYDSDTLTQSSSWNAIFSENLSLPNVNLDRLTPGETCSDSGEIPTLVGQLNTARLARAAFDPSFNKELLEKIVKTSAAAALISKDMNTYAANIANIGDASVLTNDSRTARAAYNTSYQYGTKQTRSVKNLQGKWDTLPEFPQFTNSLYVDAKESRVLSRSDLKLLTK